MATVTKDFRLKSGLVVEGSNATVNGSDVITANSIVNGNHSGVVATYDSNSKTIGLSVDVFNLNIDTQGPLTYNNNVLDLSTGYGLQVGTGNDLMLNVSDFADDLAGIGLNFNPNSLALDVDYTEVANIAYVDALGSSQSLANTVVKRDGTGGFAAAGVTVDELKLSNATNAVVSASQGTVKLGNFAQNTDVEGYGVSITANGNPVNITGYGIDINSNAGDITIDSLEGAVILSGVNGAYIGSTSIPGNEIATKSYVDGITTDDIEEGSTNLYFTDERAQDAVGNNLGNGLTYDDASGTISVKIGNYDNGAIGFDNGYIKVRHDANPEGTGTLTVQGSANQLAVNTQVIATRTYADGNIANALANAKSYTDDAINNLVDGAPALLDTLNEIAAAINDDENYATTMTTALAGKQANLNAGAAISSADLANNIVSVLYADGLDRDGNGKLIVSAGWGITSNASGVYLDTSRFGSGLSVGPSTIDIDDTVVVTHTDLDGYLNSNNGTTYVALTDYADALVAAGDPTATPTYEAVDVNSIAKHVASTVSANGTTTAYTFDRSEYRAAKFLVKVSQGSHTEVSEILLTLDTANNIAMTEYAVVGTNGSLSTITAENVSATDVDLKVTTTFLSTVNVVGTLIA